jgi:hypothetical protein
MRLKQKEEEKKDSINILSILFKRVCKSTRKIWEAFDTYRGLLYENDFSPHKPLTETLKVELLKQSAFMFQQVDKLNHTIYEIENILDKKYDYSEDIINMYNDTLWIIASYFFGESSRYYNMLDGSPELVELLGPAQKRYKNQIVRFHELIEEYNKDKEFKLIFEQEKYNRSLLDDIR